MTNEDLPLLYKRDTKKGIRTWKTWVEGDTVLVESGTMFGKKVIKAYKAKPKNVGRSNATTAEEQAKLEAESKWKKQLDKNYHKSLEECNQEEKQLENPMLAYPYDKKSHLVDGSWYAQPKLDGLRCLIRLEGSQIVYKSRGNKRYATLSHLDNAARIALQELPEGVILDGEIYCHGMPLNEISSAVKKKNKDTEKLQFWWYDIYVPDVTCEDRLSMMSKSFLAAVLKGDLKNKIIPVETSYINKENIKKYHDIYVEAGFEGLILRNPKGLYTLNQRSSNLLKYKEFEDTEFKIVGRAYDKDGLLKLVCETKTGEEFEVVPKGGVEYRKELDKQSNLLDKLLTVQHQGWGVNGLPLFPVGVAIRATDSEGNVL